MKRFILCAVFIAASFVGLNGRNMSNAESGEYVYGFILSCGKIHYREFNHELTPEELLDWTDFYEKSICSEEEPGEIPID